jgi:hypothetical protein
MNADRIEPLIFIIIILMGTKDNSIAIAKVNIDAH